MKTKKKKEVAPNFYQVANWSTNIAFLFVEQNHDATTFYCIIKFVLSLIGYRFNPEHCKTSKTVTSYSNTNLDFFLNIQRMLIEMKTMVNKLSNFNIVSESR